ncbi:zinc-ribbon domain-containing protein [Paenibacillus sp. GXUN7292]|uniref:zinc-ribbon domain-containing protein n=1 Tax=Paenibacillus sp. GXUN7292 TaxID=3422499 RepID=UPI003D7E51D2
MFCSKCGIGLANGSRFCSGCGSPIGGIDRNQQFEVVTQSFNGGIMRGIQDEHRYQINQFLNNKNFQKVHWNFSIKNGRVYAITLTCDRTDRQLPYRFGISYEEAKSGKNFGWLSSIFTGWNVEKGLQAFQAVNPNAQIKATRPIHDQGMNYGLYILHTYKI